jgi:hypothetical protein
VHCGRLDGGCRFQERGIGLEGDYRAHPWSENPVVVNMCTIMEVCLGTADRYSAASTYPSTGNKNNSACFRHLLGHLLEDFIAALGTGSERHSRFITGKAWWLSCDVESWVVSRLIDFADGEFTRKACATCRILEVMDG